MDPLDAREVEPAAYLRHGLLPEDPGRLPDAAEAHRLDAAGPAAAPLLARVGHHGLHLGRGAVPHAHVGAVGLDEHLLREGVGLGRHPVAVEVPRGGALRLGDGLPGAPQRVHHRRGRHRRAPRHLEQPRRAREGHVGAAGHEEPPRRGAHAVAERQAQLLVERAERAPRGVQQEGPAERDVAHRRRERAPPARVDARAGRPRRREQLAVAGLQGAGEGLRAAREGHPLGGLLELREAGGRRRPQLRQRRLQGGGRPGHDAKIHLRASFSSESEATRRVREARP